MIAHSLNGTHEDEKEGTTEHMTQFHFISLDIKLNLTMRTGTPHVFR